jgi:hypothetical protein
MLHPHPLAILLSLPLCSCHVGFPDGVKVDGVRLEAQHEEVIEVAEWPAGLRIEATRGDLRVEPGDGPDTLTVQVYERVLGLARPVLEDGLLKARTQDGSPWAIGRVVLRTSRPLTGLTLATGCGDVRVQGVQLAGRLSASSGLGDVELRAIGEPEEVALEVGKGDITLANLRCARLEARSGLGDVRLEGLAAREAELSSGLGDVHLRDSSFEHVQATTGLGDIESLGSTFQRNLFHTGLGSVRGE